MHTNTHTHIHSYTHTHIHTQRHTHMHAYMHTYIRTSIHIYIIRTCIQVMIWWWYDDLMLWCLLGPGCLWVPSGASWVPPTQGSLTPTELSCFPFSFLNRIVQSWSAGLQVQIQLIHTPYRTLGFSWWFPFQNCPKLAWSRAGPDSINSTALQNFRVFLMVSFTELSEASLPASRARFHQYTPPTELSCFPCGLLNRIV